MQAFYDFFVERFVHRGYMINMSDLNDHHLRFEIRSSHEQANEDLTDELLIPLMTRFMLLISNNCDPDPRAGILVQKINTEQRYVIVMKQSAQDDHFIIAISITVVLP